MVFADETGAAAVVYFGQIPASGSSVLLLDFDIGFVSQGLLQLVLSRFWEIASRTRLLSAALIFTTEELRAPFFLGAACSSAPAGVTE